MWNIFFTLCLAELPLIVNHWNNIEPTVVGFSSHTVICELTISINFTYFWTLHDECVCATTQETIYSVPAMANTFVVSGS